MAQSRRSTFGHGEKYCYREQIAAKPTKVKERRKGMMQRVMAVDPGKSTGIVVGDFHDDREFSIIHVQQFKYEHWTASVYDILNTRNEFSPDIVVCEQFDLRPGNNFLADLTPVRINAVLEWEIGDIVWQTPAMAKTTMPDHVLKLLDFWPTGASVGQPDADDARDAGRHLFLWAVAKRHDEDVIARIVGDDMERW
nr:MAG TPA: Putative Holliday junction resolvase [Caudoviricetes sp.]